MIENKLNYANDDGDIVTVERYFIGGDPKPTIDISNEPVRSFQTHCPCCGAPVDLDADKCPYCDVPYEFRRGKRAEVAVYDDAFDPDRWTRVTYFDGTLWDEPRR